MSTKKPDEKIAIHELSINKIEKKTPVEEIREKSSFDKVEKMIANLDIEDVNCNICFHVNYEPVIFNTCKHSLCAGCAGRWLAASSYCPMCRTRVDEIALNEDLKRKAEEFLQHHPDHELPPDIKWEQCCYETVFWSIQQRKSATDRDAVYYGEKPVAPENYTEEQSQYFIETTRKQNIGARLDILTERVEEQSSLAQQHYKKEFFNNLLRRDNRNIDRDDDRDEDQEWRMVPGRGLIRVPRSTNRHYCPLRFRRSHST